MKKLMITAAALMVAVAAYGQGQFQFFTRDTGSGNVLTFVDQAGNKIAGANYFVDVLAGADANSLADVSSLGTDRLVINRNTAAGAPTGFTTPFSAIYTLPGKPGGTDVVVGYRAYQGTSWDTATVKSSLVVVPGTIKLTEPPATPNAPSVGTANVTLVPEPATWALGLIGLGSLLALRRRK